MTFGTDFNTFFKNATGFDPFPYQIRLATGDDLPSLIDIPTGVGKTAGIVLSWLWRRRFDKRDRVRNSTPRRLVYCLPMRVLIEQTRGCVLTWLNNLRLLGGTLDDERSGHDAKERGYKSSWNDPEKIVVTVLMGGEDKDSWDIFPERDSVIIGTQDMLLSRALNRGYGMSRYRWPLHFGLLNNDCLWVFDEVQLMGSGLPTSVQLDAFRRCFGNIGPTKTIWMSATMNPKWLKTVDFSPESDLTDKVCITEKDRAVPRIEERLTCRKLLKKSAVLLNDSEQAAKNILSEHIKGTRTIAILNTIKRATNLFKALKKKHPKVDLILLHSQFRHLDKEKVLTKLIMPVDPRSEGVIVVSTQVIEAGVDISSKTMFTELAPWPSLVQRFGRCNRYGNDEEGRIFWSDLLEHEQMNLIPPYDIQDLIKSKERLLELEGMSVSSINLPSPDNLSREKIRTIRNKDIIDLFDTTRDMAGFDIDISSFIRENEVFDVQVFWRDILGERPSEEEPRPARVELCSVHISDIRKLVKDKVDAWYWDYLEGGWDRIRDQDAVFPGIILMLRAKDGRYNPKEGWDLKEKRPVEPITILDKKIADDYNGEQPSETQDSWKTIEEHTEEVLDSISKIAQSLEMDREIRDWLLEGARWHDAGKAHNAFQAKIRAECREGKAPTIAKAPKDAWKKGRLQYNWNEKDGRRKHFRHELVSGLLALLNGKSDIIAYLAASHHHKVRTSIRSLPNEFVPQKEGIRFARGVWDEDVIPEIDLGGGIKIPRTVLDLSFMDLGYGPNGKSWSERVLTLRDEIGIFKLAFLEGLLKASDERASGGIE